MWFYDDKAGVRCLHGPGRREAAGRHKRSQESGWVADFTQYHGRLGEHRLNALRLVTLEQLGYRKSASCTSCVARCSRSHCVVMPVAMMARTAASAMVEAMYIDARIMLLPRSRSGGIESACHQHSGWEWLTKPFKKLRWASRPNRLANLQGTDDQAPSRLTHCRRGQMKQSWPSFISGSSTDQGGGKRQPITNN